MAVLGGPSEILRPALEEIPSGGDSKEEMERARRDTEENEVEFPRGDVTESGPGGGLHERRPSSCDVTKPGSTEDAPERPLTLAGVMVPTLTGIAVITLLVAFSQQVAYVFVAIVSFIFVIIYSLLAAVFFLAVYAFWIFFILLRFMLSFSIFLVIMAPAIFILSPMFFRDSSAKPV